MALGKLERLLYRNLMKKGRALDARPELRGYHFDVGVDYMPDDGLGWRRLGERSRLAQAVREGITLEDAVRSAFRSDDPPGLNCGFKYQSLLSAFTAVADQLPAPPAVPEPLLDPLVPCDVGDDTKSLVFITHPLSFFSEVLTNQSVALLMADGSGQFRGFTLNSHFGTVQELFQLAPLPKSLRVLSDCEVRVGGYMKDPDTLTLVGIHCYPDIPDTAELLPGVYVTLLDKLADAVRDRDHPAAPEDITVYMGHQEFPIDFVQGLARHGHGVACEVPSSYDAVRALVHPPVAGSRPRRVLPDPRLREEQHNVSKHVEYQRACLAVGGHVAEWARVPRRDLLPESALEDYMRRASTM